MFLVVYRRERALKMGESYRIDWNVSEESPRPQERIAASCSLIAPFYFFHSCHWSDSIIHPGSLATSCRFAVFLVRVLVSSLSWEKRSVGNLGPRQSVNHRKIWISNRQNHRMSSDPSSRESKNEDEVDTKLILPPVRPCGPIRRSSATKLDWATA